MSLASHRARVAIRSASELRRRRTASHETRQPMSARRPRAGSSTRCRGSRSRRALPAHYLMTARLSPTMRTDLPQRLTQLTSITARRAPHASATCACRSSCRGTVASATGTRDPSGAGGPHRQAPAPATRRPRTSRAPIKRHLEVGLRGFRGDEGTMVRDDELLAATDVSTSNKRDPVGAAVASGRGPVTIGGGGLRPWRREPSTLRDWP